MIVRSYNFVLEDTVEHLVRQVLEHKLAVIVEEFGVDKAADVMDSVDVEPAFDVTSFAGIQDPGGIEEACEAVVDVVRETVSGAKQHSELLADAHELDAASAKQ